MWGRLLQQSGYGTSVSTAPPRKLVGTGRIYYEHFWNDFASRKTHSTLKRSFAYAAAYARGTHGVPVGYVVSFSQAAKDSPLPLLKPKLTMPVLECGEKPRHFPRPAIRELVATNATMSF